jgi:hypothetical protein
MARELDYEDLDADDVRYMRERPWKIDEAKSLGYDDVEDVMKSIEDDEASSADGAAESGDYESLTLPKLRELARGRQLDPSGNKKAVIETLKHDDETKANANTDQ